MNAPNSQHLWASILVDELVRGGARHAVICPGSRSTPLAYACAQHPDLKIFTVPDERSAAFLALGMARASHRPPLLICTSGTAVAHFLPAVIEAHLTHLPMIVLSADRPPELHGFGANQSIDQNHILGRYVRHFVDLPVPDMTDVALRHLRSVAARAASATLFPGGVAHLNVPFREPLAPTPEPLPALSLDVLEGRADRRPFLWHPPPERGPNGQALEEAWNRLSEAERLVVVCGPMDADTDTASAVHALCNDLRAPLLAESTSGIRFGARSPALVMHHDAILRFPERVAELKPDVILRLGGPLTTRQLQSFVDGSGAFTLLVHDHGDAMDPNHRAHLLLEAPVGTFCRTVGDIRGRSEAYRARWHALDSAVQRAFAALDMDVSLTEPAVARAVVSQVPVDGALMVASSMPIRDVDAFSAPPSNAFQCVANRGAAGIDGLVSTAFGLAAAGTRRTVLLTGDTAFLHDLGGLVWGARLGLSLVMVVVNNDGGRIFSFLPVGQFPDMLEKLFTMPHGRDLQHAAALAGASYARPSTTHALKKAVADALAAGGVHLIEARVDGSATVEDHRVLWDAAKAAMERA